MAVRKQINYLRDYAQSRRLADKIAEFYKDNPAYPPNFHSKVKVNVYLDEASNCYFIKSNLSELLASVYDIEERLS